MTTDLERQIERARLEARRRHHEAAMPEHLLGVVLDEPRVIEGLRELVLDPLELRELLDARLGSFEVMGGYRDSAEVPLAPALQGIVERLTTRGWRSLLTRRSVLDALLVEPSIAALVFALRRGNDYRHILSRAQALAVVQENDSADVAHVVRALLDLPSFVEAVKRGGGSVERMHARIAQDLVPSPRDRATYRALLPSLEPSVERIIAVAMTMARRSKTSLALPTIRQLCLALAKHPDGDPFWRAAGMDASAFVRAVHVPDADAMRARGLIR